MISYILPEFLVIRDENRCIQCQVCVRQCSNEVHYLDEKDGKVKADDAKCVNCQRCVTFCPTHAARLQTLP
nr:4Fe-4S dicluster domain-containing protein [Mahella sp.]